MIARTQAEALHKQFKAKKEALERQGKGSIVERYGNAARTPDDDEAQLLLGQTEGYVEYNAAGRVIKGQEQKVSLLPACRPPCSSSEHFRSSGSCSTGRLNTLARSKPAQTFSGWLLAEHAFIKSDHIKSSVWRPSTSRHAHHQHDIMCWHVQARSRYEEDVHPGNHTSVFGSWWKEGDWGYACCHQTVKNSYCTGEAGREAAEHAALNEQRNLEARAAAPPQTSAAMPPPRVLFFILLSQA